MTSSLKTHVMWHNILWYEIKCSCMQSYKRQNTFLQSSAHYITKFYAVDCRIAFNTISAEGKRDDIIQRHTRMFSLPYCLQYTTLFPRWVSETFLIKQNITCVLVLVYGLCIQAERMTMLNVTLLSTSISLPVKLSRNSITASFS